MVQSQPRQIVRPYLQKTYKKRTVEVSQGGGPEFKSQYRKKKKVENK
jgi:hypothetical protein